MYELLIIPIFFLWLLFQRIRKIHSLDHISFLFFIWFVTSIVGYLYTKTTILYEGKGPVTILAVLYLLLMFYISMQPLQKSKILTHENYIVDSTNLLKWAMYFIAICSYLPFIENIIHLITGNNISTLGENYEMRNDSISFDVRAHMSWLGARLNSITLLCKYITPIILMNYLSIDKKKNIFLIIGLLMGIFNPAICMFNMGSRWVAIEDIFFFTFLFILYRNLFSAKIRRNIHFIFISIVCFLVIGIISITIGRFEDTNYNLSEWMYRYIGEGYYNFSSDMWYVDCASSGMHIFRDFYENAISRLNRLMGIRMYVFYTYVGDFFADFGIIGCMVICILLGLLGKKLSSLKEYSIYSVFAFSMYCKIFLTGFTYIVYINTLPELMIGSLFFIICNISNNKKQTSKYRIHS